MGGRVVKGTPVVWSRAQATGGLEVLRQIKTDERTRHIPVVVLASSREESGLIESYDLGVNSYIVKPVDGWC